MFPSTHWSLLAEATLQDNTQGRSALNELCDRYRTPAIRYVQQRWRMTREDAEDVAQGFFLHFLRERLWQVERSDKKGKFRNLFLVCLKNFAHRQHRYENVQKRGGNTERVSLNYQDEAESAEFCQEDETAFDGEWALNLLRLAVKEVSEQWASRQRGEDFTVLSGFLPGSSSRLTIEEAARKLNMRVEALRTALSRLRKELRLALRGQVAATVGPDEVEEEIRYLQRVLSHQEIGC